MAILSNEELTRQLTKAQVKIATLEQAILKLSKRGSVSAAAVEVEAAKPAKAVKEAVDFDGDAPVKGYYYSDDLNKALYIDAAGKFWRIGADGKRGEKPIKPVDMDAYEFLAAMYGPNALAKKLREGGSVQDAIAAVPSRKAMNAARIEKELATNSAPKAKKAKALDYDAMESAELKVLVEERRGNVAKIVEGKHARARSIAMRAWLVRYDARKAATPDTKTVKAATKAVAVPARKARSMG